MGSSELLIAADVFDGFDIWPKSCTIFNQGLIARCNNKMKKN